MIIDKNMWNNFVDILKNNDISTEAIIDEFNTTPEGGNTEDDLIESNEQSNEISPNDSLEDDFGMGDGDLTEFGSFSGDGENGDNFSVGGGSEPGLGTALDPTKNPFKGQNGRAILDSKLAELYVSVQNTLELIQENSTLDRNILFELSSLLENITKIIEVVFIQPIETTQYRWALCVKAYELLCKQFCTNIKKQRIKNNSMEE
ncbi:MAG: hypothetical protein LBE13_14680 [Bacteroidales bacterium]|jgi:hypothetical protein|nr:hypothetical protein [Bacteroidales bacterium]